MGIRRQVAFEPNPVAALDAALTVRIDKEMLLGASDVMKNESLSANVLERLIKFEPNRWQCC